MKKLFVGHLHFSATRDELHQLFAAYGPVNRVDIARDYSGHPHGFAFVEMARAEDADRAVAALNGTQLGGRTLNVHEARPRPKRAGREGSEHRRSG